MIKLPCSYAKIWYPAFVLLLTTLFFTHSEAATFTVTKTADTDDNVCNSDCSLREAIAAANNAPSDDLIEFDPVVFATPETIVLNGDTFAIANSGTLTINGTGADKLSIYGYGSKRQFYFMPQSNVTLRRMMLDSGGGSSNVIFACGGGAILANNATSVLEDMIIVRSRVFAPDSGSFCGGGGINNRGTMTIRRSRIEGNRNEPTINNAGGGGIFNGFQATLTISESSITGNTVAGGGGGINNNTEATLNLINSTVSGNSATGNSSGIGGGIINFATVNAVHSTIVSNTANSSLGGVSTSNSTGTYNSRNSIYANNMVGTNASDFSGPMISGGYNLIENTTATVITGDTTGNILGQDPMLEPLANAGIGITLAHKPAVNSPVIDKGKTFGIFADQRSVNRPVDLGGYPNAPGGDGADIGAIELQLTDFPKAPPFDFDGDHTTDISIFRSSGNQWWINRSFTNTTGGLVFGGSTDKLVPADYTGDGKADVAIFAPGTGTWYILRSETSTFYGFNFGTREDTPAPGDFDGDAVIDPAVYRPSNGAWYIKRSSDGDVMSQFFGIAEDKPVVADYDGDRKDDIAIFRPSTGTWWISRSSAGGLAVQFGQAGDKTVHGDYTGDGKADIAVWRESNGFWYILRSENFSFYAFPFGSSGDLPVTGDYDGDGKFDAAVYRPSNSAWYLMRSTAGVTGLQFGVSGDYPIPNVYVR